jgi:Putative zinc-finger
MAAVSCAEIRELFSARVDDALSVEERAQLDAHLATCADCVQEWQRFERAVSLLRATEPARAPAGFVDRVLAARPRPWYRRLARFVLVPWTVKLPLEAAAILLVAGLAVVIFQRSPELQRDAYAPPPAVREPAPETPGSTGTLLHDARQRAQEVPTASNTAPDVASTPKAGRRDGASSTAPAGESVPRAAVPSEERKESTTARDTLGSADSPRKAKIAEPGPLGATAPEGAVKQEPPARAETALKSAVDTKKDDAAERGGAARPAPAVPPAATALAAPPDAGARAMQKSAEVQRLAAAPPGGVQARLPVADPVAAERTVRDLVARANGQVASRVEDGAAIILALAIPTDRWEEVKRSLENLGALRLEPRADERARLVRITLRLER